jgi:hypothetical protein
MGRAGEAIFWSFRSFGEIYWNLRQFVSELWFGIVGEWEWINVLH